MIEILKGGMQQQFIVLRERPLKMRREKQIMTNKLPSGHSHEAQKKYQACHFEVATIPGSMSCLQGISMAVSA